MASIVYIILCFRGSITRLFGGSVEIAHILTVSALCSLAFAMEVVHLQIFFLQSLDKNKAGWVLS